MTTVVRIRYGDASQEACQTIKSMASRVLLQTMRQMAMCDIIAAQSACSANDGECATEIIGLLAGELGMLA